MALAKGREDFGAEEKVIHLYSLMSELDLSLIKVL